MAAAVLRAAFLVPKALPITDVLATIARQRCVHTPHQLTSVISTQIVTIRHNSFFNKKSSSAMWDSVSSVSNQGRMRGRASRGKLKKKVNFYAGARTGVGEAGMNFPGLNAPVIDEQSKLTRLSRPPEKDEQYMKLRDERLADLLKRTGSWKQSLHPLERGYTGNTVCGTSIGPPNPVDGYAFDGFDTKILQRKWVANMTSTLGVQRSCRILAMTGNKNGLIGLALGKGKMMRAANSNAKSKASQRLVYVERYEDCTVYHNFTETYHRTRVIITKMPKGYGLKCHQVIKTICELVGITDIHVKAEGRVKNTISLARAFVAGLLNQTTFQDFANETGHHVVEYNKNRDFYPVVVASPNEDVTSDFVRDENFDFDTHFYGGKLPLRRQKTKPHYASSPSWAKKSRLLRYDRLQYNARLQRIIHDLEPAYNSKRVLDKDD